MSASFDFLASAPEWLKNCLKWPETYIDKLPPQFSAYTQKRWTFPSQLLATLMIDKRIGNLAKNGNSRSGIQGYPHFVRALPVGSLQDGTKFALWKQKYLYPTPQQLNDLPQGSVLIKADVELTTPFFSRDDRPFYPTENVLKRDILFDVPFLAASSLKGLLRWAYRLANKSSDDTACATFLFGSLATNEHEDEDAKSIQGALHCYPVFWTGTVGLDVINPMNTETGAGKGPIKYEVLKEGGKGSLYCLLLNRSAGTLTGEHVSAFLTALDYLVQRGGLSAKSSCGWGKCRYIALNAAIARHCGSKNAPSTAPDRTIETPAKKAEKGNDSKAKGFNELKELLAKRNQATKSQSAPKATAEKNATDWLWTEPGVRDFKIFTTKLCSILQGETQA